VKRSIGEAIMLRPTPRAAAFALALAFATSISAGARGSGLDAPLVGSGQSSPTTADAAAIHWNPGALADIERFEVFTGAGLVAGRVGYRRERRGEYQTPDTFRFRTPLLPPDRDPGKRGWAEEVVATPIAPTGDVFIAAPIAPGRIVAGLGVFVPYAASLDFPEDGAQKYQLRDAFIVATHVSGSLAVRVLPNLSLGGSVTWVSGLASLTKVQDFAALPDFRRAFSEPPIAQPNDFGSNAPSAVRELDVLGRPISITNAVSHGISFNAGLLYKPTERLRLGVTYQHGAAMRYRGRFALDMNDEFFTQDLAAQGLKYPPLVRGEAELTFRLPKRITTGAAYRITPGFQVDGFVSYVFWSDVDAFVVTTRSPDLAQPKLGIGKTVAVVLPRNWNDTIWAEANGRFSLTRAISVSATVGYQSPASPDATIDVGSPDGHRLIGGLGGVVRATSWLDLHADARAQGILPRTVTTSQNDLGNGRYTMVVGYVGGHAKARF
jgi:long-chain fatty acid transport protein